jgi:hypothetical protein
MGESRGQYLSEELKKLKCIAQVEVRNRDPSHLASDNLGRPPCPWAYTRTALTGGSLFLPHAKAAQECVCVAAEPRAEGQLLQFLTISTS